MTEQSLITEPQEAMAAYHADRTHASQTMIKALDVSAARFKGLYVDDPVTIVEKDTVARRDGRCLHALTLQPDLFEKICPIMPRFELDPENKTKGRTNKAGEVVGAKQTDSKLTDYYQDKKSEFYRAHAGRDIIDEFTLRRLKAMKAAILEHDEARFILESAEGFEVPHHWENRIKRRCLMDIVCPALSLIGDIKTMAAPPTTAVFAREAARWRYWIQAPWYLQGANDKYGAGIFKRFVFICVHSKAPHEVALHQFDDEANPKWELGRGMSDLEWARPARGPRNWSTS
jgi:hypothetical protein